MIYGLRYHEDVECVCKEVLQEMVRAQPGHRGCRVPSVMTRGCLGVHGALQDIRNCDAQAMTTEGCASVGREGQRVGTALVTLAYMPVSLKQV